ncbi:DCC-interacting protein 13-beta isoform X3 [Phycodurus eques]|uniref:DCC-interacting protein 13-beta isoform X3 n=1 Tax=Phycodurus eques TaxID=693459 RepID=UPI002ACD7679|nr:DCC-interacting protein 13-beta isoform X3 [Phycodurus eques]
MPAVHHKLLLEDALQDSPQTRSLLSVFEEDAANLTDYTNQLLQSMQRVFGAQSEMGLATEQLSRQLLAYEKKNFALGKGDEEVVSTLQNFAKTVEELNSLHLELANQMADTMVFPLIQFREKDLTEISTLKEIYGIANDEHEAAMVKYSRLPKKRENEKVIFFKKGLELVSKKLDNFLSSVSNMTQNIQAQLDVEAETMRVSQKELLSVDDSVYMLDNDTEPVNRTLIQKAGFLNIRNKTGLVTTAWDRLYFFTQGGNLMCQPRGAVAGGMVLDLDNSSVMAIECEDRHYCFQITSPSGKTSMILQAESKKEYEEWICTVNNISRQIYLTDNPEAVAIRLNQTAIQAVTPVTSFEKRQEGSPDPDRAKPGGVYSTSAGSQKSGSGPESEDLIAPGTPIQFDIVLPASEFQDQNRVDGRRTNPFGETDDDCSHESDVPVHKPACFWGYADSLLQQVFAVRFLGSMAVRCGDNQEVIYEAMRQVLAARAIHNIFRTTESHLMVTSSSLRLIDPQTQVTRISFQLGEVCQFAAHQENSRLMGLVVEGRDWSGSGSGDDDEGGEPIFSAFVFESNTEGEKICYTMSLAKDITEAKKDPAALAQLMKTMPLTNDGKFLLLDAECSDTADGDGLEDLESEA